MAVKKSKKIVKKKVVKKSVKKAVKKIVSKKIVVKSKGRQPSNKGKESKVKKLIKLAKQKKK